MKERATQSQSRERGKHHNDCVYMDSSIPVMGFASVLIILSVHTFCYLKNSKRRWDIVACIHLT